MAKHMTKLLAGTAALALTAGAAFAADLPSRRAAPAPFVAVPVFTWTGFYAGVNAGYGFNDSDGRSVAGSGTVLGVPTTAFTNTSAGGRNEDGFTGGGQVGYNYQFGVGTGVVIGIEGDIQYTDFGRRGGFGFATVAPVAGGVLVAAPVGGSAGNIALFDDRRGSGDFYGTVRGRVGYAFDRVLVYATGGVAFFDDNNSSTFISGSNVPGPFFTSAAAAPAGGTVVGTRRSRDNIGFVVGAGVEYAVTNNITARVEGFYVDRDGGRRRGTGDVIGVSNTGATVLAAGSFTESRRDESFAVIRAGLNYKFNLF